MSFLKSGVTTKFGSQGGSDFQVNPWRSNLHKFRYYAMSVW